MSGITWLNTCPVDSKTSNVRFTEAGLFRLNGTNGTDRMNKRPDRGVAHD